MHDLSSVEELISPSIDFKLDNNSIGQTYINEKDNYYLFAIDISKISHELNFYQYVI
jgi:hypothetical protein